MLRQTRIRETSSWGVVLAIAVIAVIVVSLIFVSNQGSISSVATSKLVEFIGVMPDRIFSPGVMGERLAMVPENMASVPAMSHADSLESARFSALAEYYGFGFPEMTHAMRLDGARLMAIAEYYLAKDR